MYLVVQTVDTEIIAIESFKKRKEAMKHFKAIMDEDNLVERDIQVSLVIAAEMSGTLRIAGDDSACVQASLWLIERGIKGSK